MKIVILKNMIDLNREKRSYLKIYNQTKNYPKKIFSYKKKFNEQKQKKIIYNFYYKKKSQPKI